MNEKLNKKYFFLIVAFAIVFDFIITDGLTYVIRRVYDIPFYYITLPNFSETFWPRIIAAIIGTAAGGFVIGTYLRTSGKLAAILFTLPTSLFWLFVLILPPSVKYNSPLFMSVFSPSAKYSNLPFALTIEAITLIVFSPIVGLLGWYWGNMFYDEFQRPKSVLNIKWYHWLWIFPFYLNKAVAVPLYTLLLLWEIDLTLADFYNPLLSLISNFGATISRIIVFFILAGAIASISQVYTILSDDSTSKVGWKNGLKIIGHALFLWLLYLLYFYPG